MQNPLSSLFALAPLTLAQLPSVTETEIGRWLLAAAAVAVIANQGFSVWKNITSGLKEKPPPADTYVPIKLCELTHKSIDQSLKSGRERMTGIETSIENLRIELKTDNKGLHIRINDILEGVARLEGKSMVKP